MNFCPSLTAVSSTKTAGRNEEVSGATCTIRPVPRIRCCFITCVASLSNFCVRAANRKVLNLTGMWLSARKVTENVFFFFNFFLASVCPKMPCAPPGSAATAEDPAAIATIQSAATFSDQPIKYVFKTEGTGGQVRSRSSQSGRMGNDLVAQGVSPSASRGCFVPQVTYRVIQVSDGQVEGQTDGAAAVSLVAGFPATSQTVTQVEGRDSRSRSRIAKMQLRQRRLQQHKGSPGLSAACEA